MTIFRGDRPDCDTWILVNVYVDLCGNGSSEALRKNMMRYCFVANIYCLLMTLKIVVYLMPCTLDLMMFNNN